MHNLPKEIEFPNTIFLYKKRLTYVRYIIEKFNEESEIVDYASRVMAGDLSGYVEKALQTSSSKSDNTKQPIEIINGIHPHLLYREMLLAVKIMLIIFPTL